MDIQKAFDSVDHDFFISALKNFGFGTNFIPWVKILLKSQESCVMNGGFSTVFFNLERGTRQGDPISAYFFIIIMEIFFTMIRDKSDINGINICNFEYKLTSYADDTTCFTSDLNSIKSIMDTFDIFSNYSGSK